jgi:hypothetical protein
MIWPLTLISPHTSSNTNAILHHPSNLIAIAIHDSNPTQHKPNPPLARHIHIIFYDISVIIYHSTPQIEHGAFNQPNPQPNTTPALLYHHQYILSYQLAAIRLYSHNSDNTIQHAS